MWNKIISKLFKPSSTSAWNNLISPRENLPGIISKLFQRFIAAHEYFPTCSMSLKWFYFSFRHSYTWNKTLKWFWNYLSVLFHISPLVTCEIKHWDNFKIISKYFYFTCNHGINCSTINDFNSKIKVQQEPKCSFSGCWCIIAGCMYGVSVSIVQTRVVRFVARFVVQLLRDWCVQQIHNKWSLSLYSCDQ